MARRAIVLVLDGCGAGAAPDAADFGDSQGVSTIKNVWNACNGLNLPNLRKIGFLEACGIDQQSEFGQFGRLQELSKGKDSVTGHWEMMGILTKTPFPTYPNGFPAEIIAEFERRIGTKTVGNKPASGTAILDELGEEHLKTGFPIVYTSADSVYQIACHESVVPIEKLHEMCVIAREILVAPNHVARVIARPFEGDKPGEFKRTVRRKDFPLAPPHNLVDEIGNVFGIGVISELFGGRGFREVHRTQSNPEHFEMLKTAIASDAEFIFCNFEDFDMLYGHRNDPAGFGKCLEQFDGYLGQILAMLQPEDLLIITADHGNDPTDASTDHSREYVPVCLVANGLPPRNLGDVPGMTAVGATVASWLGKTWNVGTDLLESH
ncbi:MAG: phosphopentomutase [Armatimonadetes bacterium]|nr:phosphopentomutase [Armatimonadota bacterium]